MKKAIAGVAVAAAFLASGAAQAAAYDLGTITAPATIAEVKSVMGSFTDTFAFNLTGPVFSSGAVYGLPTVYPVAATTLLTSVKLFTGTPTSPGASTVLFAGLAPFWSGANTFPAAGNYFFEVKGTVFAASPSAPGKYGFTVDVTPVPEPETYALFLAGLGMVGMMARRRVK